MNFKIPVYIPKSWPKPKFILHGYIIIAIPISASPRGLFKTPGLRWLETIYMSVGYVLESRFSAGMI